MKTATSVCGRGGVTDGVLRTLCVSATERILTGDGLDEPVT